MPRNSTRRGTATQPCLHLRTAAGYQWEHGSCVYFGGFLIYRNSGGTPTLFYNNGAPEGAACRCSSRSCYQRTPPPDLDPMGRPPGAKGRHRTAAGRAPGDSLSAGTRSGIFERAWPRGPHGTPPARALQPFGAAARRRNPQAQLLTPPRPTSRSAPGPARPGPPPASPTPMSLPMLFSCRNEHSAASARRRPSQAAALSKPTTCARTPTGRRPTRPTRAKTAGSGRRGPPCRRTAASRRS